MWSSLTISHRLFASSVCVCAEVCAFRMPRRVLNYATAPRAYERESRAHMKAALDEQSRMHDANASLAKQDAAQLERTARAHAQHVERIVSEREELRKMQVGRRIRHKNKKNAKDAGWSQTLRAKRCVCIETLWALLREAFRNLTGRRRLTDSEFVQSRSNLAQISLKTCAFHDTNKTHDAHFTMHDVKHARRGFCEAHTRRIRSSLESCTHPRELHTMHHACREPRDESFVMSHS